MEHGKAIIVDGLRSLEAVPKKLVIYDREIGVNLLYQDPNSRTEQYLIRYPARANAQVHRRTAAQTIVVLEGRLVINDEVVGPGSYCHFPPGEPMYHAPPTTGLACS
jgi:quercetin dioxygenase-like cupin family protein